MGQLHSKVPVVTHTGSNVGQGKGHDGTGEKGRDGERKEYS